MVVPPELPSRTRSGDERRDRVVFIKHGSPRPFRHPTSTLQSPVRGLLQHNPAPDSHPDPLFLIRPHSPLPLPFPISLFPHPRSLSSRSHPHFSFSFPLHPF